MSICDNLNDKQRQAALHTEGPLLVLAGAGSGKTSMMTHRIAHLVSEKGVPARRILAVTFTNKAANEMKERAIKLIGDPYKSKGLSISTFHSFCYKVLREFYACTEFSEHFSIADDDDSKKRMKKIIKNSVFTGYKESEVLDYIAAFKRKLIRYNEPNLKSILTDNGYEPMIADFYIAYQEGLKQDDMMDFDDLIMNTVLLLKDNLQVRQALKNRFGYIMVDEFQDTDHSQFQLIQYLAQDHHNLCVVGDDDQSIYSFRGADVGIILGFQSVYPESSVISLEQNYRSTKNILDAANSVIKHNHMRMPKSLWTNAPNGDKIRYIHAFDPRDEATYVTRDILNKKNSSNKWADFTVLYRINALSREMEEALIRANIPYVIYKGVSFYQRKEVKDMIAFMKVIAGYKDSVALERIINVPTRGIGKKVIGDIRDYANEHKTDSLSAARFFAVSNKKLQAFFDLIDDMASFLKNNTPSQTLRCLIDSISYEEYLNKIDKDKDGEDRIANVYELVNKFELMESGGLSTIDEMLENIALATEAAEGKKKTDSVTLMTIHASKGLEYDNIYVIGMDYGLFGSYDDIEIEEERRLCYVAITRAKSHLTLLHSEERQLYGKTGYAGPSPFIGEIDKNCITMR